MEDKTVFIIEGEQQTRLLKFVEDHKNCRCCSAREKFCFTFIPCMLGIIISVRCTCGKTIDLSDL